MPETLMCPSCSHRWEYTGDAEDRTSCPKCTSSVHIEPNSVDRHPERGRARLRVEYEDPDPVDLKCPNESCGREWTYTGAQRHKAPCPSCRTSVRIKANRVEEAEA